MVNSRTAPGHFFNELKNEFERVVKENIWEYKPVQFKIALTGQFDKTHDKVVFEFTFGYDSRGPKLGLVSLKATLNDEWSKEYAINWARSGGIPLAGRVHQDLVAMKEAEKKLKALVSEPKRQRLRK